MALQRISPHRLNDSEIVPDAHRAKAHIEIGEADPEQTHPCGGHFREEHQTPDGEAQRDDENFAAVFAWEFQGNGKVERPKLHREPLHFEAVHLTQRSYK